MTLYNDKLTLGTTHVDTSQGIFEDLLKAEELEDGQVDRWVKTETTLIRTKGRVELDTIATVYVRLALVILPYYAELYDTLWNLNNVKSTLVLWVCLEERL